ncbi:hypothetical protein [Paenibacillus sacheonensis]|uniref:Glycosyl hydrolase family 32 N-terminal domain-containing protein n=1 Tax=Paenibacillus sacheonensis TaxID=742054 RepID=A0A7X4YVV6_9BACL|nr:hypothetical protein [Paenibacillus sacheonensis]MBM7568858.1 putative GH43/DUF377 family glycosyl hydrolase [Paenibacillus sacheonensis]NBC72561.1 hypothetical protein [Paenibacillus sacheonensis]
MITQGIEKYLTPYKLDRPVLTGSGVPGAYDELAVDCPFVFRHQDKFFMLHVGFNGVAYQTALATSDNLIDWTPYGVILKRGEGSGWDSRNAAGCWLLRENDLDGVPKLKKWNDRYWLVYHAYPDDGYEAGPARIGLAWTQDEDLLTWNRLPEPILTPEDGEAWERGGLYKECIIEHEGKFYMFYNAKNMPDAEDDWIEQTGYAVSDNLTDWTRSAANPVLRVTEGRWDSRFVSDPCVVKDGDRWLMYFFGFDGRHAQEGLALSDDLTSWTKLEEPILRSGEAGEIDATHAHKPSVVRHEGVLYHYYCACRPNRPGDPTTNFGNEFRTICVAASRPLAGE